MSFFDQLNAEFKVFYGAIRDRLAGHPDPTSSARLRAHDPEMADLREEHLRAHPACIARSPQCRGRREMAHFKPQRLYPELKYDQSNVRTTCAYHHFVLYHGGDWSAWVPSADALAETCRATRFTSPAVERQAVASRVYHRLDRPGQTKPWAPKLVPGRA